MVKIKLAAWYRSSSAHTLEIDGKVQADTGTIKKLEEYIEDMENKGWETRQIVPMESSGIMGKGGFIFFRKMESK